VRALRDQEAGVWVATSDDVPGLATEADTMEQLAAKLQVMVPELLELNGDTRPQPSAPPGMPFILSIARAGILAPAPPDA
jgi:hypothetical protein